MIIREGDGERRACRRVVYRKSADAGYPNTEVGFSQFISNNQKMLGDVVISKVLTSNNKIEFEEQKISSDYIEIENRELTPLI